MENWSTAQSRKQALERDRHRAPVTSCVSFCRWTSQRLTSDGILKGGTSGSCQQEVQHTVGEIPAPPRFVKQHIHLLEVLSFVQS